MYMVERYLLRFPKFVLKLGVLQLVLAILIGFYDTEPRMSYRAIISGIKDYGARKDGPYVERAR